jgi:hypothetical protein
MPGAWPGGGCGPIARPQPSRSGTTEAPLAPARDAAKPAVNATRSRGCPRG